MDVPEPWIVQATRAHYDLDNIRMEHVSPGTTFPVEFQLKRVLVAGQCEDTTHGKPPNGLQLMLYRDQVAENHAGNLV